MTDIADPTAGVSKLAKSMASQDAPVDVPAEAKVTSGRTIKYLGSSDIRELNPGENLLGTQKDMLTTRVEWNALNSHLVHTSDYPEVPDAFWNQLLTYDTFADVTYMGPEEMPVSDFDLIYRPHG